MMTSWKTTLAGLIGIAAVVVPQFWPEYAPLMLKLAAIATSLGLIAARDNNVPSAAVPAAVRAEEKIIQNQP